ncbi:SusC/RagA family TonB-linked outer membrane protein [Maribacter sp. 1_MG-2023]|uniref:SusC/RagA family TonB-linked outer membrane protein n=1 Tax=Maribacter sp. 1_MG-2023 TaxID=3062677 RepID=UPI0026E1D16C|nr:SusC/RagA family TonB-linked outer membrane protein [Maribacter sp. 1_MG-2023]MDO6470146.1 SusC/RagA family TonB-linked outer membrane protein [Maribacter sp. 1_MG-2023]
MRTKLNGLLTLLLALVVHISFAQQKTVSGTVTDEAGLPLPGVNIVVEGTTTGTQTDFDGNYSITASEGQSILFTYIGQKAKKVTIGASNTLNVVMTEDAQALDEVVVTAQGIKKEKQALGYAVAEVSKEQLEQRAEGDVGRILTGKASGVNITAQSGLSGSGTSIVIRGLSSFSGSNQPLFIVDGVPFDSGTNGQSQNGDSDSFVDGNNGSSRFLDLDPNNIANVNVLKGLAAATLYGTAGRNGVILITTKNGATGTGGAKKNEITVSSSLFFNQIASLPDYQDEYGNGFDQAFGWFFSNWGPSFKEGGVAGWGSQASIDENGTLAHPYSTSTSAIQAAFPELQDARYDYKPYDSVEKFFRTGVVKSNSVNFNGGSEDGKVSYNANFGHLNDEGFTPGNELNRYTIGLGGRAILSNKFTVSGTMNFSNTDFVSPPIAASTGNSVFGTGSSLFANLFYTPRSIDIQGLPFENPVDGSSVYYRQNNSIQHPLWTVKNAQNRQVTNRVFGNAALAYEINDNLNLTYRFGLDVYSENNTNSQNKGGVGGSVATQSGILQTWNNTNTIFDHNLILTGQYELSEKVGFSFNTGATTRREVFDQNGVASTGQQAFGVLRHFNFQLQDEIQYFSERNIIGLYGQLDFDYDRMAYLTLSGRKDYVSNLATENNSIFYPSASVSLIPTKIISGLQSQNGINYLKLRAGYGTSANFPTGYPVASTLNLDTQFFQEGGTNITANTSADQLGNPNLKPELLTELEFGLETRLFNNRLTLDASYYRRTTNDLIIERPLDPSTGFTETQTNVGEIKADGIELDATLNLFRSAEDGGFNWSINSNWTTNETEVTDLGLDTDLVVYAGFTNLGNAAIVGEPLGVIVGSRILRDDNGEFVVNSTGSYAEEEGTFVIGDPNPDWTLNVGNSISYKNLSFNFLMNYTHGGDIYSRTTAVLLGRGLTTDTSDRLNSFILPGVQADGTENAVAINNSTFYFSNVLFGPDELGIYDASVIRLQEISLGYSMPSKWLDKTPFGSLSFTLSGFNLYYEAINIPKGTNFDPNVAGVGVGNGRGFDYLNGPSSKRYGLSVKASF